MSFFEIYGGRVFDLLNKHNRVQILEDGNNLVKNALNELKGPNSRYSGKGSK